MEKVKCTIRTRNGILNIYNTKAVMTVSKAMGDLLLSPYVGKGFTNETTTR